MTELNFTDLVERGTSQTLITTSDSERVPQVTQACWNWCSEQHFIHQANLTVEGISIIALALIVLFIYKVFIQYWDYIKIEGLDKEKLAKFVDLLPEFVMYLLIGFFIWFVWFS